MSNVATKQFRLDLSTYQVETSERKKNKEEQFVIVKEIIDYPLRSNLSTWLRGIGMFKTAEDVAEAVVLAKSIRDCSDDFIDLDEKEAVTLKQVLDRLILLTAEGQLGMGVGGELHEEAICRVVNMKEITQE